jgi:hypothetical protein
MEISRGAVKSHTARGMTALRAELKLSWFTSSPAVKTRRFLLVKPVAARSLWHRTPARA